MSQGYYVKTYINILIKPKVGKISMGWYSRFRAKLLLTPILTKKFYQNL